MSEKSKEMFGVANMAEYLRAMKSSAADLGRSGGAAKIIMSLLSDSQEMMAGGAVEEARKAINRAKYLINEFFGEIEVK